MRLRTDRSNDLAPLSAFQSWLDCTINTSGCNFRKGQDMTDTTESDPKRTCPRLECDDAAIVGLFCNRPARNSLVGIGFSFGAGFKADLSAAPPLHQILIQATSGSELRWVIIGHMRKL
jgi:hypothetical protein